MSDQFAIKVEHVSKSFKLPHERQTSIKSTVINFYKQKRGYEKQEVLRDISFEIHKGEFFGVVGRNGSGKSTLLKLLAGIYSPNEGTIKVNGKLTPFIELGVGFNPELSGRENVYLNGALLGFSRGDMNAMYDEIVHFAELERFMDQKLKNYSSGMQVRLAFSIAIRAQSDILLIDEVLAVGDAAFQQKCFNYFEELKKSDTTIILVTHDMGVVKRFCTGAAYIVDGKLKKIGSAIEIADMYTEANIERTEDDTRNIKGADKVEARIVEQTSNSVLLEFSYSVVASKKAYVGLSLIRDGITIADITTPPDMVLAKTGKVRFSLKTDMLNFGVYQITASLFTTGNRECIAIAGQRNTFTLQGVDETRGNALKLANTWEHA